MPDGFANPDERSALNFTRDQGQQAKRTGLDPRTLKRIFQECWVSTDSRAAFAHALESKGFWLANGDRRSFVAVDFRGEVYSVARTVGTPTKTVTARLGDSHSLPSVEQTKAMIAAKMTVAIRDDIRAAEREFSRRCDRVALDRRDMVRRQQAERQTLWLLAVFVVDPFALTTGRKLVAALLGITVAGIGAILSVRFLLVFRGGYGLKPHGSDQLEGAFAPGRIRLRVKDGWIDFNAHDPHSFLMREHSARVDEARAEERARGDGYGQQPDYVRRAFEILLDHGLNRTVLAEVALERQARDIIRHLHHLDAYARGADGAGMTTRQPGQPGQTPLGKRPALD